jgi:hypothetical protein
MVKIDLRQRGAVCPPRPAGSPPEDIYEQMKANGAAHG